MRSFTTLAATAAAIALVHCGSEDAHELAGPAPGQSPASRIIAGPPSGADAGRPAPTANSPVDAGVADANKPPVVSPPPTPTATTPPTQPPGQPPAQGDPCATVQCGPNQTCVPYAHGQPLGVCVDTCDCSNCGNCGGDNNDGRWSDMQEYCGAAPNTSPATKTCNRACAGAGTGCIPFGSVSICWPLEGCFSL